MTVAAVVCPVVHTTLNWIVIGLLLTLILVIGGAVVWSIIDRRYTHTANPDVSAGTSGQRGRRGDREADATDPRIGRRAW